jgi:hypothetical protein
VTERTVTEQQVIDAMNKHGIEHRMAYFEVIWDELFPELPKLGELILAWDNNQPDCKNWYEFSGFADGNIGVINYDDDILYFDNYRRQTPAERGESND